jgi:galacturan 1,4-alpha-galacturonidase
MWNTRLVVGALLCVLPGVFASPTTTTLAKRATCTPASAGSASTDDVPAIAAAIKSCGNGGIIVIPAGKTYQIRSTLSFAGCTNCDFQVEGTLKMSDDTTFWNGVRATFLLDGITGAQIHSVTGSGVVDGNGVPHWIKFAADKSYKRPTMMYINNSKNIKVHHLTFKNPANVFHSVTGGSSNVVYDNLIMTATPKDGAVPKNTDGFDVGTSTFVTISNTKVTNQDDCVAFKSGSSYTTVTKITCSGSHGLSVGSLGGGSSADTVQNIIVNGATMIDSTKAVGIKLYDGASGHTAANVRNVTFSNVVVQNCEYAAQIQSCYNAASDSECSSTPSKSTVTDVFFTGFSGTTATKFDPTIANLNCPSGGTCKINFSGWTVKSPSGKSNMLCSNVDSSTGLSCSGAASG